MSTQLTPEEIDDILYCARAGEVAELTEVIDAVVARLGAGAAGEDLTSLIAAAKNESENTALHYAAANGHADVLAYLLPRLSLPALLQPNEAGNTALHWAALNGHLPSVRLLLERIEALAPLPADDEADEPQDAAGDDAEPARAAWDVRNKAGRGPMSEAQLNGKEDVVRWLLERMVGGPTPSATKEEVGEDTPDKKEEGEIRIVKGAQGDKEVEQLGEKVEGVSVSNGAKEEER